MNIGCRLSGSPEQGVKTLIISGPGGVQDGGLQDHCHCQYSQREDQPGLLHAAGNVWWQSLITADYRLVVVVSGGGEWKPILVYSSGPTFELELELELDLTWPWPDHVLTLTLTRPWVGPRVGPWAWQYKKLTYNLCLHPNFFLTFYNVLNFVLKRWSSIP